MSDRCPLPECGGEWIEIDGGPSGYCRRCGLPEKHWHAVQALKDRVKELEEQLSAFLPFDPTGGNDE